VLGNAERMEAEAIAVQRAVIGRDAELSGVVRVTTVDTLAAHLLPAAVAALRSTYPGITVEIVADSRTLSLSRREADIALRMSRFEGQELVARRVGRLAHGLYASRDYLERHGPLNKDGAGHALVTTLEDQAYLPETRWLQSRLPRAQVALRSNSREVHLGAALAGTGVVLLSTYNARTAPELLELVRPSDIPVRDIWLGVHGDLRYTPRIRATIDAIINQLVIQGLARTLDEPGT
jgi:DNA-binding transcriptional LysR family regulator